MSAAAPAAKRKEETKQEIKLTSGSDKPSNTRVANATKLFNTLKSKDFTGHKKKVRSICHSVHHVWFECRSTRSLGMCMDRSWLRAQWISLCACGPSTRAERT